MSLPGTMGLQAAPGLGHGPRRAAADGGVSMVSLDGRCVDLRRLSPGVYELPVGLPKGLYLIRAGTRSILRSLL